MFARMPVRFDKQNTPEDPSVGDALTEAAEGAAALRVGWHGGQDAGRGTCGATNNQHVVT